jgi:hypothetical protein
MSVAECGYNMNWGGLCQQPQAPGLAVCAKHAGVKCAMCGAQAVLDCDSHLGNFECGAPLCQAHKHLHHPDSNAWKAYEQGSNAQHYIKKDGGDSTGYWYAYMAGWRDAMKHVRDGGDPWLGYKKPGEPK